MATSVTDLDSRAGDSIAERPPRADLDPLTGLRNAAAFERDLAALLAAGETPFAVVVVDVESFGSFDRAHGHRAGEGLLQTVARSIDAATRQDDRAYRFLDDLFSLLLTGEGQAHAERVADRIRQAFGEFAADGGVFGASLRIGTAHRPADGNDRDALLNAADASLRHAPPPAPAPAGGGSGREARLEFLLDVAEALLRCRTRDQIAAAALDRTIGVLGTANAFVALRERNSMRVVAGVGTLAPDATRRGQIRRGEGLWGRVWETGRVLAGREDTAEGEEAPLLLGVPLCVGDQVYGVVGAAVPGPAAAADSAADSAGAAAPEESGESEETGETPLAGGDDREFALPPMPLDPLQVETLARLGVLAGAALAREAGSDDPGRGEDH